ncbi:MAG: short-chain dehydrogenase [Deltaproteobacteria bacterium HGW-Deltaproteobacteria-2]|jgi:3-dehydrosphinganine reductase|nr:MAG: short-chain dehydrogenase [Deltaproteobacteria bacterium HGW-Deltaproteobacteria-2]
MFKNMVVVITGGSSGLGKALAQRFVKKGASVALVARDRQKLAAAKNELLESCGNDSKVSTFNCDVADFSATEKTFKDIIGSMGKIDILVNSAGILKEGYFEKLSSETFRAVMDINYFGTLNCIKAVLPFFKKKGGGRIVNIASLGGKFGCFGYTAYCSSKFAIVGLSETLRCELKPMNIKVQLVCPPEFDSPMVDDLNTYRTAENREMAHTASVLSIEYVADEVFTGIMRDRYLIIPGRISRLLERGNRWLPAISRAVSDYRIKRVYRGTSD